jgi:hypothetical protein
MSKSKSFSQPSIVEFWAIFEFELRSFLGPPADLQSSAALKGRINFFQYKQGSLENECVVVKVYIVKQHIQRSFLHLHPWGSNISSTGAVTFYTRRHILILAAYK